MIYPKPYPINLGGTLSALEAGNGANVLKNCLDLGLGFRV